MKIGLSMYGTTYMMGIHPKSTRPRMTAAQLMEQAAEAGLQGVELPVSLVAREKLGELEAKARERGLFVVVAAGGFDPQYLAAACETAAQLGAGVVRTVVGGADFGGDRRKLAGRWQPFLQEALAGLKEAVRAAERAGVILAVENHQDLASEELIRLCEQIGSAHFGLVLDTGNPLATAEEPVDFARRIGPYLKHVHLKDYWVYASEEGYRLVRCPLGQGAVDFPALFRQFAEWCPDVTMSVELGALEARHTRVLANDYWPDYPPRSAAQLASLLRFVQAHAKPLGEWRTPYELGRSEEEIAAYEYRQLWASLAYMKGLLHERGGMREKIV